MKLDLIFPTVPPAFDGIGDHTAHLAVALAQQHEVRVLTAQRDALDLSEAGVRVKQVFSTTHRSDIYDVVAPIEAHQPDWVLLQYNPFSYGRWGLNLSLPGAVKAIRKAHPRVRIALMVHEPFVPVESWRFAVFTTWQRWQFWRLGRRADLTLFSIQPWVRRFREWFPKTPLVHLPVGSNIPVVPSNSKTTRARLGISEQTLVCGIFGSAHESRDLSLIRSALCSLREARTDVVALYIGTSGSVLQSVLKNVPLIDAGPLPAETVSRYFGAMDLYLAPFRDGVSTRRGSFMVGLQHGIPTVTTLGPDTDDLLRTSAGTNFRAATNGDESGYTDHVVELANAPHERRQLGDAGATLYDSTFDWPHLASRLTNALQRPSSLSVASQSSPSTSLSA